MTREQKIELCTKYNNSDIECFEYMLQFCNDEQKELLERLFSLLEQKNITVSTAESCTGGLIAGAITSLAGVSSYYREGFVTYANEAKKNDLIECDFEPGISTVPQMFDFVTLNFIFFLP